MAPPYCSRVGADKLNASEKKAQKKPCNKVKVIALLWSSKSVFIGQNPKAGFQLAKIASQLGRRVNLGK